ncbi:MAG: hypothetical protein V3U84_07685 [Thiotrichaceae bacterium]
MGINFSAVIDHQLSLSEITKLVELLRLEWAVPESPLRAIPPMPGSSEWDWDLLPLYENAELELKMEGNVEFDGPIDLHGTVFKRAVIIGSAVRWNTFIGQNNMQNILRNTIKRIALLVKSKCVVYLPDFISSGNSTKFLYEGGGIECMLKSLKSYGSSAPSLDAVKKAWEEDLENDQYYIENIPSSINAG